MEQSFTLTFDIKKVDSTIDMIVESLDHCNDATIGIGNPNVIAFDFSREGDNAEEAINSAINDILKVLPQAQLLSIVGY